MVDSMSVSWRRLRKFTKPLVIWSPARTSQPSSMPGMNWTAAGTRFSSRMRLGSSVSVRVSTYSDFSGLMAR